MGTQDDSLVILILSLYQKHRIIIFRYPNYTHYHDLLDKKQTADILIMEFMSTVSSQKYCHIIIVTQIYYCLQE